MKIIIVSDTHGVKSSLERVMKLHKNADVVVHCGDSRGEMEEIKMKYPDKIYHEVRGNCDFGSVLPMYTVFELDGFTYMATHGHAYGVKYGLGELRKAAKELGADVVFYGHTHIPMDEVQDDIRMINPGACGGWGASFAIVETKDGQLLSSIVHLKKLFQ